MAGRLSIALFFHFHSWSMLEGGFVMGICLNLTQSLLVALVASLAISYGFHPLMSPCKSAEKRIR
jgi:hypothetical protein